MHSSIKIFIFTFIYLLNISLIKGQEKENLITEKVSINEQKLIEKDSIAEFLIFKKKADIDISDNAAKIEILKSNKQYISKISNEKYDRQIASFEVKNNALQSNIIEFENSNNESLNSFKRNFELEMSALKHIINNTIPENKTKKRKK